jgi:hypothetical protein
MGVLGFPSLERGILTIDYRHGLVEINPAAQSTERVADD